MTSKVIYHGPAEGLYRSEHSFVAFINEIGSLFGLTMITYGHHQTPTIVTQHGLYHFDTIHVTILHKQCRIRKLAKLLGNYEPQDLSNPIEVQAYGPTESIAEIEEIIQKAHLGWLRKKA